MRFFSGRRSAKGRSARRRTKGKGAVDAVGVVRRGLVWVGLSITTLVVTILVTSTWQRHRPAIAEPLVATELDAFCVDVLNGNGRRGEARTVASHLRQEGFRVEEISNAERYDYPLTLVIDRMDDADRAQAVARALGDVPVVLQRGDPSVCELTVVLGHDWSLDPSWEERQDEWD